MTSKTGRLKARRITDTSGLTLIELCFVLLILGLIVLAATPQLSSSYRRLRIRTAAESFANDLAMAARRTVLSGNRWRVHIWENGRGYTLEREAPDPADATPLWQNDKKWQKAAEHALNRGLHLEPEDSQWSWDLGRAEVDGVLTLRDESGLIYNIGIGARDILIHEAARANN